MQSLIKKTIMSGEIQKTVSVHACDIRELDIDVDIMTVSSFYRDYYPTDGTLIEALACKGIDVQALADIPTIDLREPCNIWLSREVSGFTELPIKRIGCIEMSTCTHDRSAWRKQGALMLNSIRSYFKMLEIAAIMGISVERIIMPILGTGSQRISSDFVMTPILNECIQFLKSCHSARHIMIVTRDHETAFRFGMQLENSYSFRNEVSVRKRHETAGKQKQLAFISYSSKDKNVADNLCAKLEARGIRVWYAPRDVGAGDYASSIVNAISNCTKFIVILSKNSLQSNHVLNEIDLAFSQLQRGVKFLPLRIDEEEIGPSYLYYLSRQHWMDAYLPPLEKRLDEFADFCEG